MPGRSDATGMIALMGSGELTATMVQVHKDLLARTSGPARAVFLDTPAGFQLNVGQLSRRVVEYFRTHVQHPIEVASFRSSADITPLEAEQAYGALRHADYVLIGPGSPTYAVRQWRRSSVPDILARRIQEGGCLVAASAAALTVGRFTLPVYEIYKVGEDPHWVEGMDILGRLGLSLVVVPHWNNAEGGTHDTRFCYMGEPRFRELASRLPSDVAVLGLDEHTACLIDLEREEFWIRGIGTVVLRNGGSERVFTQGDRLPLEVLHGGAVPERSARVRDVPDDPGEAEPPGEPAFWERVHAAEAAFHEAVDGGRPQAAANALLEVDRTLWQAHLDLENEEFIAQGREILREMIVHLGTTLGTRAGRTALPTSLVEDLVDLRERLRRRQSWEEADSLRKTLEREGVVLEDTRHGPRWRNRS